MNPGHRPSASALGYALPARWAGFESHRTDLVSSNHKRNCRDAPVRNHKPFGGHCCRGVSLNSKGAVLRSLRPPGRGQAPPLLFAYLDGAQEGLFPAAWKSATAAFAEATSPRAGAHVRAYFPGSTFNPPRDKLNLPADKCNLPARKSNLPADKFNLHARKSNLPACICNLPARICNLPADKSDLHAGKFTCTLTSSTCTRAS